MHADQFIELLSEALGLEDLRFSAERIARLIVDEDLVIDLEHVEARQQIQVYSELGPVPEGEEALRQLLAGNLFGHATGDACLACDDDENAIVLCLGFDLETASFPRCVDRLREFASAASFWRLHLAGVEFEEDPDDEDQPDAPGSDLLRV
ncbi:MAG: type III secretion system chaperone [Pirellulales bacterium]|nr:type III secretion system chaperone [Pirellulales bacterium]